MRERGKEGRRGKEGTNLYGVGNPDEVVVRRLRPLIPIRVILQTEFAIRRLDLEHCRRRRELKVGIGLINLAHSSKRILVDACKDFSALHVIALHNSF